MGLFVSPFVESSGRHSVKKLPLSSACWTATQQRKLQWASLPVPLPSVLGGTRQRVLIYRVLRPYHSTKKLYRFPSVFFVECFGYRTRQRTSLPSVTLRKLTRKNLFYLFLLFHPNKQRIYIIDITYITESTHVSRTPYISQISPYQTSFINISLQHSQT